MAHVLFIDVRLLQLRLIYNRSIFFVFIGTKGVLFMFEPAILNLTPREQLIYLSEYGQLTYEELSQLNIEDQGVDEHGIWQLTQKHQTLSQFLQQYSVEFFRELYQKEGINPITIIDNEYPEQLKEIYHPPPVLFTKGNHSLLKTPSLAIVGSRKMSEYGQQVMTQLMPALSRYFTIVSGLACGCDAMAHQTCIKNQGQTIGVIGTGLLTAYPKQNKSLQHQIATHHLLVSPLPNLSGVKRWHFPFRNRVIAGLSMGTCVIEAKIRSGSLITANYALQENRNVYSVPGNIFSETSEGCNQLIQLGAKSVLSAKDIIEDLEGIIT